MQTEDSCKVSIKIACLCPQHVEIINRNEETLGELFCFFILETILLGKALNVNPYDQPSVELIKQETKRILS